MGSKEFLKDWLSTQLNIKRRGMTDPQCRGYLREILKDIGLAKTLYMVFKLVIARYK